MTITTSSDIDIDVDENTRFENFVAWLPTAVCDEATLAEVQAAMSRPFAARYPDSNHSFGVTFGSDSENITRLANMEMRGLLNRWARLHHDERDTLPNLHYWFHQSGSDSPTGYQYWELLGSTNELGMFVCEHLADWLPRRVARALDA